MHSMRIGGGFRVGHRCRHHRALCYRVPGGGNGMRSGGHLLPACRDRVPSKPNGLPLRPNVLPCGSNRMPYGADNVPTMANSLPDR